MSFTAAQVSSFATQIVTARIAAFGISLSMAGITFTGTISPCSSSRSLDPMGGGFDVGLDATVRLPRSAGITPQLGQILTVVSSGQTYEVAKISQNPADPEIKLGLINPQTA